MLRAIVCLFLCSPPNHVPGIQQYDQMSLPLTYTIRVSVHNGRTFVGPAYDLTNITHLDVPGWKVLQVRSDLRSLGAYPWQVWEGEGEEPT